MNTHWPNLGTGRCLCAVLACLRTYARPGLEVDRDADWDVVGRNFHDDEFRIWYAGVVRFCHVRVLAVWTQGLADLL